MIIDESSAGKKSGSAFLRPETIQKNTTLLNAAGAAEVLVEVLRLFAYDVEVVQWAARAVNNMGKSRTLRAELNRHGAMDLLVSLSSQYADQKEAVQWVRLAVETLQLSSIVATPGYQPDIAAERSPLAKILSASELTRPLSAVTATLAGEKSKRPSIVQSPT
jgi:hypothetical protein